MRDARSAYDEAKESTPLLIVVDEKRRALGPSSRIESDKRRGDRGDESAGDLEGQQRASAWCRSSSGIIFSVALVLAILTAACSATLVVWSHVSVEGSHGEEVLEVLVDGGVDGEVRPGDMLVASPEESQRPRLGSPYVQTAPLNPITDARQKIYVYEDIATIFSEALRCTDINIDWVEAQSLADVEMNIRMLQHPARVLDPAQANMFYIPIVMAPSVILGHTGGGGLCPEYLSHEQRIRQVVHVLEASPWYRRNQGADHFIVTAWRNGSDVYLGELFKHVFRNVVAGFFEVSEETKHEPRVRHVFDIPYVANQYADSFNKMEPKSQKVYNFAFRSSMGAHEDLSCSTGLGVRSCVCSLAKALPEQLGACRLECVARAPLAVSLNATHLTDHRSQAEGMAQSHYCLVMHGDTLSSSRLYSAIASDCLPVIISDGFRGAFNGWAVDWNSFVLYIPEADFVRDPVGELDAILSTFGLPTVPGSKAATMLSKLRMAKPDVLWHAKDSRVASNIVHAVWDFIERYPLQQHTITGCSPSTESGGKECGRRLFSLNPHTTSLETVPNLGDVISPGHQPRAPFITSKNIEPNLGNVTSSGSQPRDGSPIFLHIPKTGGTTVEITAAIAGLRLGMCAASRQYSTADGYACNAWHRPPSTSQGIIPNSFCIVRNPYARLASQYNYEQLNIFGSLDPVYDSTCASFEKYLDKESDSLISNRLLQCQQASNSESTADPGQPRVEQCDVDTFGLGPSSHDCHLVPQSLYTSSCETVLVFEQWEETVVPWLQFVAGVQPTDLKAQYFGSSHNESQNVKRCWDMMNPAVLKKVHQAYLSDFTAFGYHDEPSMSTLPPTRGCTTDVVQKISQMKESGIEWPSTDMEDALVSCLNRTINPKHMKALLESSPIPAKYYPVLLPSLGSVDSSHGRGQLQVHTDNVSTLPPVDWVNKTLLIVVGIPFSGTSALEGLIGTSPAVTDLCAAGTWQCEDTALLHAFGFIDSLTDHSKYWDPEQVSPAQFAYAFTDYAHKYWDMSKDLLMDKTPELICKHVAIKTAAASLDVPVKFVVLTRHPFSMTSDHHLFNQTEYLVRMRNAWNVLQDSSVMSVQVRHQKTCLSSSIPRP